MNQTAKMAHQLAKLVKHIEYMKGFSKEVANINLTCAKSVKFVFDPFQSGTGSIRQVLSQFHARKTSRTNTSGCAIKADVQSGVVDPRMEVTYQDGHRVIFKTIHLSASDIVQYFNKFGTVHSTVQWFLNVNMLHSTIVLHIMLDMIFKCFILFNILF